MPKKKGPNFFGPRFRLCNPDCPLEVDPSAYLHLSRVVHRGGNSPKSRRTRQTEATGIRRLKMVENIGELHGHGDADALGKLNFL